MQVNYGFGSVENLTAKGNLIDYFGVPVAYDSPLYDVGAGSFLLLNTEGQFFSYLYGFSFFVASPGTIKISVGSYF